MAITNLTGTTWVFDDALSGGITSQSFNINFTSNSNSYQCISLDDDYQDYLVTMMYYTQPNDSGSFVYAYADGGSGGEWYNNAYKTIEITGGTDVEDTTLIEWLESNATQITEGGSISVGNSSIAKSFVGSSEVLKMILNGATVYEKQAPAPTGFSGTVSNTGYIQAVLFVDRMYDSSDPDYDLISSSMPLSCNYFYMLSQFSENTVVTATGCTYEEIEDQSFVYPYGYKVTPTADNWVFTGYFID